MREIIGDSIIFKDLEQAFGPDFTQRRTTRDLQTTFRWKMFHRCLLTSRDRREQVA
jgi:hypothetical protein